MYGFLKTKSSVQQIQSGDVVDKLYSYWRPRVFANLYIGYAAYYFNRKSFNYVTLALVSDFGLDKSDIGLLGTLFYVTYGLSKFFSGIASDNSNPRYFMGIGLILTGIMNIAFGFSNGLLMFAAIWLLNGIFQGWGWPACSRLLTSWYSQTERGAWWSVWNTAHSVGNVLLALLAGYLSLRYDWQEGMIVPGVIGIMIGLFICYRLRDSPCTLGLPSIGTWKNDKVELIQENEDRHLNYRQIMERYIFGNKYIWLLSLSYIFVYVVRIAINDWGNLYLVEKYGFDLITANSILILFEVGAFAGSLVAGKGSDSLFFGNRVPMNLAFSVGIFCSVSALWAMPVNNYIFLGACFLAVGFFVSGPQMLLGMAAAECSHKNAPGAATGFIGLFAYVGAAIAGYPLALIVEAYSWNGFFIVLAISAAATGLLLLPFLQVSPKTQEL